MKGKLIVIDGGDGSGKTVQSLLLRDYLKKNHLPVSYFDFPQYDGFYGQIVARFLSGEFGGLDQVSPYLTALVFALDRATVSKKISKHLKKGNYIVCNRYATSNFVYQGAKILHQQDRDKFNKWVFDLEYKIQKLPKEDIVIYLFVPWQIGSVLSKQKGKKKYLSDKSNDIHEDNGVYRKKVEKLYLENSKKNKHWLKINCVRNGNLLNKQAIHAQIIAILKQKKIISKYTDLTKS